MIDSFRLADPLLWKKKAMAFVTRTHQHLWGKNNEDPMVFLFRRGLAHDFIRAMHLGWNKYGQKRSPDKWGLESPAAPARDSLFLPAGIVVPYIVEKELKAVFILSMEEKSRVCRVPGSFETRIVLGRPDKKADVCKDLLTGLKRFQDSDQTEGIIIDPRPDKG